MRVWDFLKETFSEWSEDRAPRMGAALAYYTVFSLAPVLVIAIGVAGIFFGQRMAEGRLMHEIRNLVGPEGAGAIRAMIANAAADRPGGVVATMMGVAALVFGATGAFVELQDALNTIWKVQPRPRGLLRMLKDRFLSFTLVVGIGFLLLVSLVISAALAALGSVTARYVSPSLLHGVNFLVSFGVITVLFAMIFKILPDAKIAWRDVWLGAAVASLLFSAGKFIIGLYLGKSGMASAYGAAGSLVIVLVWVYYSAQILFLGAEREARSLDARYDFRKISSRPRSQLRNFPFGMRLAPQHGRHAYLRAESCFLHQGAGRDLARRARTDPDRMGLRAAATSPRVADGGVHVPGARGGASNGDRSLGIRERPVRRPSASRLRAGGTSLTNSPSVGADVDRITHRALPAHSRQRTVRSAGGPHGRRRQPTSTARRRHRGADRGDGAGGVV